MLWVLRAGHTALRSCVLRPAAAPGGKAEVSLERRWRLQQSPGEPERGPTRLFLLAFPSRSTGWVAPTAATRPSCTAESEGTPMRCLGGKGGPTVEATAQQRTGGRGQGEAGRDCHTGLGAGLGGAVTPGLVGGLGRGQVGLSHQDWGAGLGGAVTGPEGGAKVSLGGTGAGPGGAVTRPPSSSDGPPPLLVPPAKVHSSFLANDASEMS